MNCIICINLSLKVIFILQSQFVSHLDRMSSFRGASLPILSIPKTVSKSAVTHIGMHSPPSIHTPGYSMCTVSSSLSSFSGSHIPKYFFLQDFNVAAKGDCDEVFWTLSWWIFIRSTPGRPHSVPPASLPLAFNSKIVLFPFLPFPHLSYIICFVTYICQLRVLG